MNSASSKSHSPSPPAVAPKAEASPPASKKRGAPGGQLIAVRDGGGATLVCALCGEDCICSEMTVYGSSGWACKRCKTNYNRQLERNKTDAILKRWWTQMPMTEKQQWFKDQKALNPEKHKQKRYSDSLLKETDEKSTVDNAGDLNDSIPQDMFVQEEMTKGSTFPEATTRWHEIITTCDESAKEWHEATQQWLLLKFRGVRRFTGTENKKASVLERKKDINDAVDFEEAEELRKSTLEAHKAHLRRMKSQACSGAYMASELEEHRIQKEDGSTAGPMASSAPLPGDNAMSKQIHQDALVQAGEIARQLEFDERDEHMAREQKRMQGQTGAGRPKKTKTKLLGDSLKLLQDKKANVVHAKDSVKEAMKEAVADAERDFPTGLPDSLAGLKGSMEEEVRAHCAKMDDLITLLEALNVQEMVNEGGDSFDTEVMKRKIVDLLAPLKGRVVDIPSSCKR